ncbi:MAG: hypothetical protein HY252_02260 [Sphingobacteriales bacterium]|nr:hypothetical protein [Sphingobacteriales bacterium]
MSELLQVNDKGELQEEALPVFSFPLYLRIPAIIISYLFHPLFLIGLMGWYIIFHHPTAYLGYDDRIRLWRFLIICVNGIFFPLVSVLLLKAVGFVKSILLPTQRDRIVPIVITNIFFFWTFLIFKNFDDSPAIMKAMTLGVFLASSSAILLNIYLKISLHAIGVGGLVGLALLSLYKEPSVVSALPLTVALLIAGFVCTSRLIASNHRPVEIYPGFIAGLVCQFISWWIMA